MSLSRFGLINWFQNKTKGPSETISNFTEAQAYSEVLGLKEVRDWMALFDDANKIDTLDRGAPRSETKKIGDGLYLTHFFESYPDHIVTFNWYLVNLKDNSTQKFFQNSNPTNTLDNFVLPDEAFDADIGKRSQRFVEMLKTVISNSNYLKIPSTDLEVKVPNIFEESENRESQTNSDVILLEFKDRETIEFNNIIDCGNILETVKFNNYPNDISRCIRTLSKYTADQYKIAEDINVSHNFFVHKINTDQNIEDWLLDNVSYQGVTLREDKEFDAFTTRLVGKHIYYILNVACCGGYEMNYYMEYSDPNGKKSILKFGTNDYGLNIEQQIARGNVLLDVILATLKSNT